MNKGPNLLAFYHFFKAQSFHLLPCHAKFFFFLKSHLSRAPSNITNPNNRKENDKTV